MREQRLSDREIEDPEVAKLEVAAMYEHWPLLLKPSPSDLAPAGLQELRVYVYPDVVPCVEVPNEMNATTHAAAADVEQPVPRGQPLVNHQLKLELANLMPEPAPFRPMPIGTPLALHREQLSHWRRYRGCLPDTQACE